MNSFSFAVLDPNYKMFVFRPDSVSFRSLKSFDSSVSQKNVYVVIIIVGNFQEF